MTHRKELLEEAARLTSGDRDKEYGEPDINLEVASKLIEIFDNAIRENRGRGPETRAERAHDEGIRMVLVKISRVAAGPKPKADTYVDGAAYFAIAGQYSGADLVSTESAGDKVWTIQKVPTKNEIIAQGGNAGTGFLAWTDRFCAQTICTHCGAKGGQFHELNCPARFKTFEDTK